MTSSATGFCVSKAGYFVTAQHFTKHVHKMKIQAESKLYDAVLVSEDAANDIAVLKIAQPFPDALAVRPSKGVRFGEAVATIGFPQIGVQGSQAKLGRGEVSSLSGIRDDPRQFQISVPVQPGNSGGPLLDLFGNVVGVVVGRLENGQSVNYAIKSNLLINLLEAVPQLTDLPAPVSGEPLKFEEMVAKARPAVVLVQGFD
jgi:S1-C subfamily serine protease